MGYVAVEAGAEIIERAADLHEKRRLEGDSDAVTVDQITAQFGRLTDRVASESGLAAPELAALAVKQAQGATTEAAFLLRAYRSTLQRWGTSTPTDPDEMTVTRRIAPAFKDVPDGQYLGATNDFTPRLLDFGLLDEEATEPPEAANESTAERPATHLDSVVEMLRADGLLPASATESDEPPADVTRQSYTAPAPRSGLLQELARGETGAMVALAYSAMQGYGQVHPTLVQLRVGHLPVRIEHPYTGDPVMVTTVPVTEALSVVPLYEKRDDSTFAFGYGLVFGRNERKAIAMTVLDASLRLDGEHPAENEEFVRTVADGIDSLGYMQHLKLPHYVTFDSIRERIRSARDRAADTGEDTQ